MVSEFAEVDALPGAKVEFAVGDGDCEADAEEGAFCVGGHVVGAFHGVLIVGLMLFYDVVHNLLHINSHIGVGILIDGEGT